SSHAITHTNTTPLSLHDALPIFGKRSRGDGRRSGRGRKRRRRKRNDKARANPTVSRCRVHLLQLRVLGVHGNGGIWLRSFRLSRSEEHTSELQSRSDLVCRLLLE